MCLDGEERKPKPSRRPGAFEVIPGVTSAVAVPAYAGIPVTHRTLASTVAFVTGHEDPSKAASSMEWPRLASADGTLVFLMGMKNLPAIVARLIKEGKSHRYACCAHQVGDAGRSTYRGRHSRRHCPKGRARRFGTPDDCRCRTGRSITCAIKLVRDQASLRVADPRDASA